MKSAKEKEITAGQKELQQRREKIGDNLAFGAKEAYKLLRSNITLSIEDDGNCKVLCITSAVPGEGKSTTSINLAYTLSEAEYRVLLIEGDMRLPHLAETLGIEPVPGLSNLLTSLNTPASAIRESGLNPNMFVIPAGEIPPNPSELLSSRRMEKLIESVKTGFDYIIIDLPPVNVVSDGLNIIRVSDGIILVAREGYSDKREISAALSRLNFLGAKVLGFVLNDAAGKEGSYNKTGKKNYHYKKSYSGSYYENAYIKAESAKMAEPKPTQAAKTEAEISDDEF